MVLKKVKRLLLVLKKLLLILKKKIIIIITSIQRLIINIKKVLLSKKLSDFGKVYSANLKHIINTPSSKFRVCFYANMYQKLNNNTEKKTIKTKL